jgi:cell division protein FtsW
MIKSKPDYILSLSVFALVIFGLVMISSASIVRSYEVTNGATNNLYLYRQLIALGIGVFAWILVQRIDYHIYKKYSLWFLILSLLLLASVFIPGLSKNFGANRWIGIGDFIFQPSELVKLFLIIFLSGWLSSRRPILRESSGETIAKEQSGRIAGSFFKGFLPFLLIMGVVGVLLMKEPDLGTTVVIFVIGLSIIFIAGGNIWQMLALIPAFLGIMWLLIKSAPYRMARVIAYLNPAKDIQGISYHVNQAIIAIGSGGLWGLGYGASKQKFNYLPQAASDSIFAIIAEELGFIRAFLVILVYILIAFRGYSIAKRVPDDFGRLMATGITTWFIFQAVVNLGAMMGLLPFTGVPLPFISYGGSSLVISLIGVAILLNISKHANRVSEK